MIGKTVRKTLKLGLLACLSLVRVTLLYEQQNLGSQHPLPNTHPWQFVQGSSRLSDIALCRRTVSISVVPFSPTTAPDSVGHSLMEVMVF